MIWFILHKGIHSPKLSVKALVIDLEVTRVNFNQGKGRDQICLKKGFELKKHEKIKAREKWTSHGIERWGMNC